MCNDEFRGTTVLINTACNLLGIALAESFEARGAALILCDPSVEVMAGCPWPYMGYDSSSPASMQEAVRQIIDSNGVPDIILDTTGCAVVQDRAFELGGEPKNEIDEIGYSLISAMAFISPFIPGMITRGSGVLIFLSAASKAGVAANPILAAANAGIKAFSQATAAANSERGVRSNVIDVLSWELPATRMLNTGLRIERQNESLQQFIKQDGLGLEHIANTAAFLASDRAGGITGAVLPVDLGSGAPAANVRGFQ